MMPQSEKKQKVREVRRLDFEVKRWSEKQGGRRENNVLSEADRQHHVPPAVV